MTRPPKHLRPLLRLGVRIGPATPVPPQVFGWTWWELNPRPKKPTTYFILCVLTGGGYDEAALYFGYLLYAFAFSPPLPGFPAKGLPFTANFRG